METVETPTFEREGFKFYQVAIQEYANCSFSAGFVEGHPVDTLYLRLQRPVHIGENNIEDDSIILLRSDELAAIAWVANGALWSNEMGRIESEHAEQEKGA